MMNLINDMEGIIDMKTKIYIFYLTIITLLTCIYDKGFCEISINRVDGNISEGSSINIYGTGFGPNMPNILIYDNFEKGSNGNVIKTGVGSAIYGKWDGLNPDVNKPHYSNVYAHSGFLSFWANCANGETATEQVWSNFPTAQREIFTSFWAFVPLNGYFPGESGSAGNWKLIWPQGSNWTTDDNIDFLRLTTTAWYLTGNGAPLSSQLTTPTPIMNKGEWTRFTVWIKGATDATGAASITQLASSFGNINLKSWNNVQTLKIGGSGFLHFLLNGFTRGDSSSNVYFDDVYVAYGSNSRARVEICDSNTYNNCKNISIFLPTTWTDNGQIGGAHITATVILGSNISGTGYIYIYDANGLRNQNGYPIPLSTGKTPNVPLNLQIK